MSCWRPARYLGLQARLLYHKDGKSFSRKNFPRDTPRLAVGYLADESGSMSGMAINASISTGIILEDLCRRMELPCYIGGFTSSAGGLQYISYVEYGSVDAKDKYRLTGMSWKILRRDIPQRVLYSLLR